MTTGLLAMFDAVRRMLAEIQTSERDGENDYAELLEKLRQLQQAESTGGQTSAAPRLRLQARNKLALRPSRRQKPSPGRPVRAKTTPFTSQNLENSEGCWSSAGT